MLKINPNIKNSKGLSLFVAGTILAMTSTCASPAFGESQERLIEKNSTALLQEQVLFPFTVEYVSQMAYKKQLEYDQAIRQEIIKEELRINSPSSVQSKFVNKALQYQNTGKWVFGGSTPGAWDCSGFILYIAKKSLGIDLYHSATVQMDGGISVDTPLKGDLVGLYFYNSSEMSSHIGIYVGDGKFIHVSETRGTVVSNIADYESSYDIRYSRIIEKDRNWSPEQMIVKDLTLLEMFKN